MAQTPSLRWSSRAKALPSFSIEATNRQIQIMNPIRKQPMRTLLMLMFLSALPCLAQEMPGPQQSPTEQQQQAPAAQSETSPPEATITVPEGTRLQRVLANRIRR